MILQLDKSEVGLQDVSQPHIEQVCTYCVITMYSIGHCANPLKVGEPAADSQDPHLPSTATHEVVEEKSVEVTKSDEFAAAKSVSH